MKKIFLFFNTIDLIKLNRLKNSSEVCILSLAYYGKPLLDKIRHELKDEYVIKFNDKGNLELRLKKE